MTGWIIAALLAASLLLLFRQRHYRLQAGLPSGELVSDTRSTSTRLLDFVINYALDKALPLSPVKNEIEVQLTS